MSVVHVVHCIDTEGPLNETLDAVFERLFSIFNIELEPSRENLEKLQKGEIPLGDLTEAVQQVVAPHLLAYNSHWGMLEAMLDKAMSEDFRMKEPDSFGGGWVYNWHCLDHVDYDVNPRARDIGYHNIFDRYLRKIKEMRSVMDGVHFHFHPHHFLKHAHLCATRWWGSSNALELVLSRRIIDRAWFPCVNRPGFHVTRPDSHWFLEQYIPFDYASQACVQTANDSVQKDLVQGRLGDWRRAPISWEPYHPDHDDYQIKGSCRRWIGRCLNVGSRTRLLTEDDVKLAFEEARKGSPVILAVTNHDFRDIRPDVDTVRRMLGKVSREYPDVKYRFSEALEAMRLALDLPEQAPCDFNLSLEQVNDSTYVLHLKTEEPTFGPQPFLAFKTAAGEYLHDNLDIHAPHHEWGYVLDGNSLPLSVMDKIGVGANNAYGVTTVSVLDVGSGKVETTLHGAN